MLSDNKLHIISIISLLVLGLSNCVACIRVLWYSYNMLVVDKWISIPIHVSLVSVLVLFVCLLILGRKNRENY